MVITYKDALIALYYLGFWLRYFTEINILVFLAVLFGFCLLSSIYFSFNNHGAAKKDYIKNILVVAIACIGILVNKNHTLGDGILLLSWVSVGILLAYSDDRLDLFNRFNWITFVVLLIRTIFAYINSTNDLDIIVSGRIGSNSISIIAIQCFFIDYICRKKKGKKTNYIMLTILMLVSLMSRGRMSILVTIILLIGVYLQEDVKKTKKLLRYGFAIMLALAMVVVCWDYLDNAISLFLQGDSSTRLYLWKHYYEMTKSSLIDVLFGVRNSIFSTDLALNHYRNLHNTFFNWHYFYGLLPCLYYILIIIGDLKREIKSKDYIMVVLLIVSILKGMSDETTFSFMMMWIYIHCHKRTESLRRK